MMRDAAEAQRHRSDALERELEDARRELESLRGRASRADVAEAKLERAERENEALRRKLAPDRAKDRSRAAIAIALVALIGGAGTAFAVTRISEAEAQRERGQMTAQAEIDGLRATQARDLEALQNQLTAAHQRAERAEERATRADAELAREQRMAQRVQAERSFVALSRTSRQVRVSGRQDLGRECTVALSPSGGECRARIACGDVEIYPAPGSGGFFSCEAENGHLVRGRDVNGSAASGDPMLDVDGPGGVITVSDGPAPAWSVRITMPPL